MALERLRRVVAGLFALRSWIEKTEIYLVFVVHGGTVILLSYCPRPLHITFSQRILHTCMKFSHLQPCINEELTALINKTPKNP